MAAHHRDYGDSAALVDPNSHLRQFNPGVFIESAAAGIKYQLRAGVDENNAGVFTVCRRPAC